MAKLLDEHRWEILPCTGLYARVRVYLDLANPWVEAQKDGDILTQWPDELDAVRLKLEVGIVASHGYIPEEIRSSRSYLGQQLTSRWGGVVGDWRSCNTTASGVTLSDALAALPAAYRELERELRECLPWDRWDLRARRLKASGLRWDGAAWVVPEEG